MSVKLIDIRKSSNPLKKYDAILLVDNKQKIVSFGARGFEDFTSSQDEKRKQRYLLRHKPRENWTKSGVLTPGFWSRWVLWNQPTIQGSVVDLKSRFGL
jgi:hypothetical protein